MPIYSVEVVVFATAYVRADNKDDAYNKAKEYENCALEVSGDDISGRAFSDPELPDFSFSPAMTIGAPDSDTIEEAD